MSDFLNEMAERSAARAAKIRQPFSMAALEKPAFPLRLSGFDLVAEIKNRSPAEGDLATKEESRVDRALQYVAGGAAAISVITEPDRFDGALGHLEEVVNAVAEKKIPVMRKDFLVDTAQVVEAKAAGASGVLLIAAILEDRQLTNMLDCAFGNDLFVLLEAFDETDLERINRLTRNGSVKAQAERKKFLVGVNTRDLRSLEVDRTRLKKFASLLPEGITCVAESGLRNAADAADAAERGYGMALVGTALMRAEDPAGLIAKMLEAGRQKVAA